MTVEFNHDAVMKMYEGKRKRFLTMTGHQGANLAALNSRVDTGASQMAKSFTFTEPGTGSSAVDKLTGETIKDGLGLEVLKRGSGATFKDRVFIVAPMEYDIYLEYRYGTMKAIEDDLVNDMVEYERVCFG